MKEFLNTLIHIITDDIFIGYGIYSLFFISISLFKRDIAPIDKLDLSANRFIIFSAIVYFLCVIISTIISIADHQTIREHYWWVRWLQPVIWLLITQILWIKRIRTKMFLRCLIAILLIVSFERYVIIVTSIHRDYLPGAWVMLSAIPTSQIIFGLTLKTVIFCLLATAYTFVIDSLKTFVYSR